MADKYPGAQYPYGNPSAPPPTAMQPGMPLPQYYPPPSYDAAMTQGQGGPQMPQGMPMPQPQMNYGQGYPGYPPAMPGMPQPGMPQPQMMPQYPPGGYPTPMQPQGYPQGPPAYQQQPGYPYGNVAPVTAVFDAGARPNANGQITVPPPPPGYMPTQAQAAAMAGQSVHVQKEKNGFFTGGKGAGFTFW